MATIRETILNVKPGKARKLKLSSIGSPMSYRQESYEINRELSMQGIPLPEGKKTYYEVNILFAKGELIITNHQQSF